ncbi:crAss001_48 related protein [Rosenbergiella collisarenosi]
MLAVFIYKSETFKTLSTEKQNTLKAQLSVMQSYISILELRINQE